MNQTWGHIPAILQSQEHQKQRDWELRSSRSSSATLRPVWVTESLSHMYTHMCGCAHKHGCSHTRAHPLACPPSAHPPQLNHSPLVASSWLLIFFSLPHPAATSSPSCCPPDLQQSLLHMTRSSKGQSSTHLLSPPSRMFPEPV